MLAHRSAHHLDRQRVADLGHDQRQAQARRQLLQLRVAGQAQHGGVERGVFVEIGRHAPRRVGEDHARSPRRSARAPPCPAIARRGARPAPPSRPGSGTVRRCRAATSAAPPRRDCGACSISPSAARRRNASRTGPRLTEKRAVSVAFDQPLARLQAMGEDVVAQTLDDMGDRRAVRRRVLPVAAPRPSSRRRLVHGLPHAPASRDAAHHDAKRRRRKERGARAALDDGAAILILSYNLSAEPGGGQIRRLARGAAGQTPRRDRERTSMLIGKRGAATTSISTADGGPHHGARPRPLRRADGRDELHRVLLPAGDRPHADAPTSASSSISPWSRSPSTA